jgi:hypothetical protein
MQGKSDQDFILMVLRLMIMVPLEFLFWGAKCYWLHLRRDSVRIEKQLLAEYFNKEANILLPLN